MGAVTDFYANVGNTYWSISSRKDRRWNCSGQGGNDAMWAKIEELEKQFGELPTDLRYSVCKE